MAFQKQFKTSYYSYNGWEYYMEIWVNTTAGTITTSEVKLGTGGPIISYDTDNEDRFSPIISSNCVIPLVIESSIQETFVKQLREVYNERDVYVHLYRATEAQHSTVKPLWSGFVLMDLSSTPDEFYPYDFKITAVDGLGLLKDIDFVKPTTRRANEYIQADMYYGPGRFTYWLKEILLKTGASTTVEGSSQDYEFTTAINWYESLMPNTSQSTDPFYITKCSVGMFHTKTDDGVYEVTNCYEVLKELLKHWGARITYWKGQFWIVQIPEYITPDSGTYINPDNVNTRTYDKSGTFIGSSDNLGDSYWTRYQLNIGDIDGGIQKLTGTNVNYLPQIREVRANNISFGGGNRYGGFPREFAGNSAPDEIIFQDQITDASDSDSFNLVIPLNVNVENGNPFYMKILFNFYCTDLTNTYYLQYDTTLTHKYYWVDISQWTTLVKAPTWDSGFISPATGNSNQSQSHIIEGFDEQILFKLYNTSTQVFSDLDLSGDYKFYLDIDAYGTNISNPGSFRFKFANAGLGVSQFFYPTHPTINVTWTNTLQSNYALQTPNIITNNAPNGNSIIQLTTPNIDPFEGMFVIITNTTGSIYGNSYVSSVNTSDVAIVDFGTLIFGDTLQSSDLGCLQVYNGTSFEKSSSSGNWGVGILTGSLAFTQILLDEYLYGQTVVIESPSMRLVTSEVNKQSSDGSGLRPNYVNPIGRLKESRTNLADVQYVFKRGAFYTLTDEWDYDGFEIKRNVDTIVKTVKNITGPNNPVTGVGSISKTATIPNSFGQVISKQIITSISSSVAAGTITSLPIALINDVVFKIGDYFNVLNSDTNEFIKFELNGQQFSDSSSLTVVSQVIADNIPANSIITFNAFDLTSQYQNKTRGTVGAFDITATSIDSGNVAISSYIDDDTFATASVNSLATSESIKAYVDGQAGHDETLQQVTDNGNTTTNSIMIGSSNSPIGTLHVKNSSVRSSVNGGANNIIIEENGYSGMTILSNSSNAGQIHFGDQNSENVGMIQYFHSDNSMRLFTNGSEKARITSGGNLGLGTTSPSAKLHISVNTANDDTFHIFNGSIRTHMLASESSNGVIYLRNSLNSNVVRITTNGNSYFNGGNLGLGTSNPSYKLDVVGSIRAIKTSSGVSTGIALFNNTAGANNRVAIDFNTNYTKYASIEGGYGGAEPEMNFLVGNPPTQKMTIKNSGNVGIGTTSPAVRLTLSEYTANTSIGFYNTATNSANRNWVIGSNNQVYGDFAIMTSTVIGGNPISVGVKRLYINPSGNVGIGTTSPTEKLHVVGDALITGDSHADAFKPAAGGEPIKFKNFGSTELARITDAGYLLIGGTSATSTYKLQVYGKSYLSGGIQLNSADRIDFGNSQQYIIGINSTSLSLVTGNSSTLTALHSGQITLPSYGSGTFTGAETYFLAVTSGGDVVEADASALPGGPYLPLTGGTLTGSLTGTIATFNDVFFGTTTYKGKLSWDTGKVLIGTSTANTDIVFIKNSNTELARITSGGNLLLGTTTDLNSKLQINGRADLLNGNELRFFNSGNSNWSQITSSSSGVMAFNTGSVVNSLYLSNLGGIAFGGVSNYGTSGQVLKSNANASPTWVDASSVIGGPFLPLTGGTLSGNLTTGASLVSTNAIIDNIVAKTSSGNIKFKANNGAEIMRLTSGGRLGIGTSSPTHKLEVRGGDTHFENTSSTNTFLDVKGTSANAYIRAYSDSNSVWLYQGGSSSYLSAQSGSTLRLNSGSSNLIFLDSSGEVMRSHNGNVLIGSTSDNGAKLQVTGIIRTTGGSVQAGKDYGFTLQDESNNNRYGLKFGAAGAEGGSNLLMLTNRSLSNATGGGEVAIGANASTTGVTETEVMRIKANTQSEVSIDGILSLTVQDTPADPSINKSSIWLDSNWDLKIKITNSSGDTVTKTIVEYA